MIQLVDKPYAYMLSESHAAAIAGSSKSSTGSFHYSTKKASSSMINPDRKRVLTELMLQLAKVTLTTM